MNVCIPSNMAVVLNCPVLRPLMSNILLNVASLLLVSNVYWSVMKVSDVSQYKIIMISSLTVERRIVYVSCSRTKIEAAAYVRLTECM